MKTIRIPEDLFCDLYLYHVIGSDEPSARIKAELERKMEVLQRHDTLHLHGWSKSSWTSPRIVS